MICPVCKIPMIVVEFKKIELDHCVNCEGVWFDTGELELLLGPSQLDETNLVMKDILNLPEADLMEEMRKCVICGQKMKKVMLGKEGHIVLDICLTGDGIWFDGGELDHLLTQLSKGTGEVTGSRKQILTFLGEAFKAEKKENQ